MTLVDRFVEKFEIREDGCWEWTAALRSPNGYGQIQVDGRPHLAHRVSYELSVGPIPDGLDIDHLCRNKQCVNPDHMEPVTRRENTMRSPIAPASLNAEKTHCPEGHPLVKRGHSRVCLPCQAKSSREYRQRLR